jgi:hypothetical protein
VTVVKLRYTVRKRGNLFWQPTPQMQALGFMAKPLGPDGPEAVAEALRLYNSWLTAKAEADAGRVSRYPPGSLGEFFDRYRRTTTWSDKAMRTREDYGRAWEHIKAWSPGPGRPTLACTVVNRITTEICEHFKAHLDRTISAHERHRTIKVLKVLLADMVTRLRLGYASPASRLVNPQPKGRWQIWLAQEIEDMAAGAAIAGFEGMSLAIGVAWQTMFSPVDVRTLRPSQLKRDAQGFYFRRARTKTHAEAFGYISDGLGAEILAYVGRQDRAQADDTPIFRTRDLTIGNAGGRPALAIPYKTKDLFAKDFRLVRDVMFPGDDRQLLDIRRSANVEADAAGADKATMGELLANGLADNRFLDETYTPPTVAKAREVAGLRLVGRARLAGEVRRLA